MTPGALVVLCLVWPLVWGWSMDGVLYVVSLVERA